MSEVSSFRKLLQNLPGSLSITPEQIKSCYQNLYSKLLDLYNKKDFYKINSLLYDTLTNTKLLTFKIPQPNDETSQDTFLVDFVKLIYSILTIYPVEIYKTPLSATLFLNDFLAIHKYIPNLTLDWYPYYKVMKYFMLSDESYFNRGTYLKENELFGAPDEMSCFLDLSLNINQYFPDEVEIELNGQKVKTNTTEQLVNKCFPRISPNGHYTPAYLTFFSVLCPPHKGRYKIYIDFLLRELRDTSSFTNSNAILSILYRTVKCNIEDDFSYLIPIVSKMISSKIINVIPSNYPNLSIIPHLSFNTPENDVLHVLPEFVIALFISPPTRQSILDLLEKIFISFESKCHPSDSNLNSIFIVIFDEILVMSLRLFLRQLSKKKKKKIYLDMPKEKGPSKEDIHKFLSMTSETKIMNIRMCFNSSSVLIETTLDPSTIDHYFKIGFQCINLMDAYDVSNSGWTILSALIMSIDKNKTVRDNFQTIFEIAANNLYREELQLQIANFLALSVSKVPFNKERTLKGCEYINFPKLASSYLSNLMTIFRSLPSVNGETSAMEDPEINDLFCFIATTLFQNCDNDVMNEILPIFTSLASDEDIAHSVYNVEKIIANYCYFAKFENVEKIEKLFRKQLETANLNFNMFRFLSIIYSRILVSNLRTIESARKTVDFLIQFTKSEDEKVRKSTWESISNCLSLLNQSYQLDISFKSDKMKENLLENANLDDFKIEWKENPDFSELSFEIFDPVFDKLMTLTDSHKINDLLNDVDEALLTLLKMNFNYTEGSIEKVVNDSYIDSIHVFPQAYKKSVPIKEKFIKCTLRIIKDFRENENVISRIIKICLALFVSYKNDKNSSSETAVNLVFNSFVPFDSSDVYYNSAYLYNALMSILSQRKKMFVIPVTDDMKELFTNIVELGASKYQSIQNNCSLLLQTVSNIYYPFIEEVISNMINKFKSIQINDFINFLNTSQATDFLKQNDKLLCQTMLIILNNLLLMDKEKLDVLKEFMFTISILKFSYETPRSNKTEFVNLLKEIELNYLNKNSNNRTYNNILMHIIYMCLKRVYDINDKILEFIMNNVTHFDSDVSKIAEACLSTVLKRRRKFTKEKIEVKEYPTIASIPNVLDQITVKYQENGVYFPLNLKTATIGEVYENDSDTIEAQYSLDADPTNSFDFLTTFEENEDVNKVFDSFKNIDIQWKNYEDNKIYDSEFLYDQSNGYFLYKKSFNHKKYEFKDDKFLIKNISYILASASNSINEKNLKAGIKYRNIWEKYGLVVGPYCIKKLHKNSKKYLSQYYSVNSIVVTKILTDMISGVLINICYWPIKDRIEFFKLVALPVICIISSNPNTSKFAEEIITRNTLYINPYCFAPLIKVLYDLAPHGPNLPIYNRPLISMISKETFMRPLHFFNSIDQLKTKFVDPFLKQMSEYNTNEVDEIIELIFSFSDCCSFSNKNSPFYSNEIESENKQKMVIQIFEDILNFKGKNIEDENLKRILIRTLTYSFIRFNKSSYDLRLFVSNLFIKHLHAIFVILNSSNIKNEEQFIESTSSFIENEIFINNTKLELDFVSVFIKELMNLSLPMQLILLENLNNLLENNIFNIPKDDYAKYEELLFEYGHFAVSKNLGNELRLKIAKILGIFEIRNSTLNAKIVSEKVDKKLIENEVLKAASIILNSFLFDQADEKVTNAFNLMEECCSAKSSKNKDFFKSVSEIFIHRHSEHVLNEVEELIIQYKGMLTPSYIC
ncbi:hypothetical protein M9Y10_025574 [Tritrichomonas musculus]|uniref:Uncharacterized protein n=1 Tax=Tritrichomonas musculus TaxID=1915356 RepID=A0ABR2H939_9EUKA